MAVGGTRGDVQPMLALALGLRARGHQIRFCAPPNFEPWIKGHGLSFGPFGRDIQAFLASTGTNVSRVLVTLREDIRREFALFAEETRGVDLILGASITCAGVSYGEKLGIPYCYVMFAPSMVASAEHASPMVPWARLPRFLNRLTWWGMRKVWNLLFRGILNDQRRRLGLGPVADTWSHIQDANLVMASEPALAGLPAEAPASLAHTGPLLLPETDELPPELERFCAAGPAPIYIGFGSMPDLAPARSTALLLEAIARAKVRAIISRGWAGLGQATASNDVFLADTLPHGKLFPRVAAVVHHGGAGTTASAARAGVPQLIVPHLADQFFWGEQVFLRGLGPRPIPRSRLKVARLTEGLRACIAEARYAARARELAGALRRDGVERTVAVIEALAATSGRGRHGDGPRAAAG